VLVAVLALVGAVPAAGQPSPDPAPVPAPPAPAPTLPTLEPDTSSAPSSGANQPAHAKNKPIKKQRKHRTRTAQATRVAPLHPPLAAEGGGSAPPPRVAAPKSLSTPVPLSTTDFSSTFLALLIVLSGVGVLAIAIAAVPERFLAAISRPLLDHRGDVALGGLTVLLGLSIAVMAALVS
jgi:hypothetical protein